MPLIRSPPVTLSQLAESVPTLENPETDKALARKELRTSLLYRNLLISPDGTTTALKINVRSDETFSRLLHRRNELRNKRQHGVLSPEERAELARVSQRFSITNSEHQARLRKLIGEVRAIKGEYGGTATLHLAGVPLIIADSIGFIRHDLVTFGIGVLAFLIVILALAFRKLRWVALPLLTCLATGMIMIGFLGLLDWPVTVISANFPSLLLIITLSLSVHLIVRYREVHAQNPQAEQVWLVREMVHSKALPCFYTAITTRVAFGSLLVSDIPPVIDFGWMMTIGVAVAFSMTFTFFPCAALFYNPGKPLRQRDWVHAMTRFFARVVERYGNLTLSLFALATVVAIVGISRLSVENRFIDVRIGS